MAFHGPSVLLGVGATLGVLWVVKTIAEDRERRFLGAVAGDYAAYDKLKHAPAEYVCVPGAYVEAARRRRSRG